MDVRVSANRAGGGASPADRYYRSVGDLLTIRLGEYGEAIRSVVVAVYFPKSLKPGRSPSVLEANATAWLAKLPRATFRKSEREIEVSARSQFEESRGGRPAMEEVRLASRDAALAVASLLNGRRRYDGFDAERFVADSLAVLANLPEGYAEIEELRETAVAKRRAEFEALDPWERLGVDWTKYAANAKTLLDDPFFWDETNGLSPHGSDTGADAMRSFKAWNRTRPDESPIVFVSRALKSWGISEIDWSIDDVERTNELHRSQPIPLRVCDETAIAVAFAAIKTRGTCPLDTIEQARRAVRRRQFAADADSANAEVLEASQRAARLLLAALDRVAAVSK